MKTLDPQTARLIDQELMNIPEKYQKNFNSTHEGYAVILEEVRELEQEVFFGEKMCKLELLNNKIALPELDTSSDAAMRLHKIRMRQECVQIAAMCARFIQELT